MLEFKKGVKTEGLKPQMITALRAVVKTYDLFGVNAVVTSCLDGKHKRQSAHDDGLAMDFRISNLKVLVEDTSTVDKEKTAARQKAAAGMLASELPDFDVILEKDHIHIEYDPKIGGVSWLAVSRGLLKKGAFVS